MDKGQRKVYAGHIRKGIALECGLVLALAAVLYGRAKEPAMQPGLSANTFSIEDDYIKWVDFTVSYEALCKAYDWDVDTHGSEYEIDWVELLAYTAAKTGGTFDKDALKTMDKAAEKLSEGETTIEELTEDLKYYDYYLEAYDAAIGGLVGVYWEEEAGAQAVSGAGADRNGDGIGGAGADRNGDGIGGNRNSESGGDGLSGSGMGGSGGDGLSGNSMGGSKDGLSGGSMGGSGGDGLSGGGEGDGREPIYSL